MFRHTRSKVIVILFFRIRARVMPSHFSLRGFSLGLDNWPRHGFDQRPPSTTTLHAVGSCVLHAVNTTTRPTYHILSSRYPGSRPGLDASPYVMSHAPSPSPLRQTAWPDLGVFICCVAALRTCLLAGHIAWGVESTDPGQAKVPQQPENLPLFTV